LGSRRSIKIIKGGSKEELEATDSKEEIEATDSKEELEAPDSKEKLEATAEFLAED
jgi:hypothetical protein